jgi:hypothetical protein
MDNLISVDSTGNLYIGNYWVYINRDDELSFMKLDSLTFEKPDIFNKLGNQQLKGKMIDDEIEIALNTGDGNNFMDEEDQNNVQFFINNPETKYVNYIEYEATNEDNSFYIINGEYKLAKNNYKFDNSNYEIYFVDSHTNSTIFYTQIINDNPFYRITVNTDNTVKLNIIGTKIKTFKLNFDDNLNINSELINEEIVFNF